VPKVVYRSGTCIVINTTVRGEIRTLVKAHRNEATVYERESTLSTCSMTDEDKLPRIRLSSNCTAAAAAAATAMLCKGKSDLDVKFG